MAGGAVFVQIIWLGKIVSCLLLWYTARHEHKHGAKSNYVAAGGCGGDGVGGGIQGVLLNGSGSPADWRNKCQKPRRNIDLNKIWNDFRLPASGLRFEPLCRQILVPVAAAVENDWIYFVKLLWHAGLKGVWFGVAHLSICCPAGEPRWFSISFTLLQNPIMKLGRTSLYLQPAMTK